MSFVADAALKGSKAYAQYYESAGTGSKLLFAAGITLINPLFWLVFVIILVLVTILVWIYSPCWTRNVKDPNDRECSGWAPAGFFRTALVAGLVIFIPLWLLMTGIFFAIQSASAKAFNMLSDDQIKDGISSIKTSM